MTGIGSDWYFIAEQSAPALHLAHPEGCATIRIVLVTVPRVSRSCEHGSGMEGAGGGVEEEVVMFSILDVVASS